MAILSDKYITNPATGGTYRTQYDPLARNQVKTGATTTPTTTVTTNPYPIYSPDLSGLQSQLQNLMSSFGAQEQALNQAYQTNLGQAGTAYQNLLDNLAKQEQSSKEEFGASRATIAEDAFTRGRNLANALASRMLSGSGLLQLGNVQNRMETGRQINTAAQTFGKTNEAIAQARQEGTQDYNTAKRQLSDSLASNLASLMSQKATAGLSGQSQIEALKQAAATSQQNAYAYNQQNQNTAFAAKAQEAYVSAESPLDATALDYNTRIASIQQAYGEAGQEM